ncbi:MAG TPA: hypothetical protein VFZ38_03510 [Vicinamibacterales bacterium]
MSSSTVAAAVIVMMSFTAGPALAQKPSPEGGQPQQKQKETPPAPMTGELVSVDESAKTLAIKTASEGEVKFSYTDKTEIVGADKIASGLAGVGTEVTVHYDSHGTAKVATRIEVRPKK